jgi:VanZ family protein
MLHRILKSPRVWQIALLAYWLALFVATHVPVNVPVLPSGQGDKLVHFAAYTVLAGLGATTWQLAAGQLTARHLMALWIAIAVYGALDEWTQIPVGRDCNFWDWTADLLGAATGLVLFAWLRRDSWRR